jgi:hypothetical protein
VEPFGSDGTGVYPGAQLPTLEELEALHRSLDAEERDELLECLLIAAPKGEGAMIEVLTAVLFIFASSKLADEVDQPSDTHWL